MNKTTKTAQFTPGPWVMRPDSTIESKDGVTVASFIDNKADMPLIAAAPAMYGALREAQELIRSLVAEEMIHRSELQRVGNCQANMWEALAQAEGKQ